MLKFFEVERPLGGWPARDPSRAAFVDLVCRCGHGGSAHQDIEPGSCCLACDSAEDASSCPAEFCCVGYRPE